MRHIFSIGLLMLMIISFTGSANDFRLNANEKYSSIDTLKPLGKFNGKKPYLNAIYFRGADLLQFCAGVTYERYLITERPMSLLFSYSYSFIPMFLFNYSPSYIIAAGFKYQFKQYKENLSLFVLPEVVYSERSLSIFHHYTSPAGYVSGGGQYKLNRLSLMGSFGIGIAGTALSYAPSVRIQANIGYVF